MGGKVLLRTTAKKFSGRTGGSGGLLYGFEQIIVQSAEPPDFFGVEARASSAELCAKVG
jgi:hypothetical protein